MRKLLLTIGVASALLAGCGGGGSSTTPTSALTAGDREILTITAPFGLNYTTTINTAKFDNTGGKYLVISGIYLGSISYAPTPNPDAPIRILKINSDGTSTNVTADIIGSNATTPGNVKIADFNGDGIDDIVSLYTKDFPFADGPGGNEFRGDGAVFLSRPGQTHIRKTLSGSGWTHSVVIADINNDGSPDIINSRGQKWINDGAGNFTYHNHSYDLNTTHGLWMNGSGVCVGDFNNTGRKQVVITDLTVSADQAPIADTVIFELNDALIPVTSHTLPVPILDRNTTDPLKEVSHDIRCLAIDLNRDGRLDLVVLSRPNADSRNGRWTDEGQVQVLINRGNWVFDDVTNVVMATYPVNSAVSYNPIIMDLNGDGVMDLWLSSPNGNAVSANHAWLNNGSGTFTRSLHTVIDAFGANGPMLPVAFGNMYSFIYSKNSSNLVTIYATIAKYTFN